MPLPVTLIIIKYILFLSKCLSILLNLLQIGYLSDDMQTFEKHGFIKEFYYVEKVLLSLINCTIILISLKFCTISSSG